MEFLLANKHRSLKALALLLKQKFNQLRCFMSHCDLCGHACQDNPFICQTCLADLPCFKLEVVNYNLLNWPAIYQLLPKHKFQQLLCLAPYEWPFNIWIPQFKYQHRIEIIPMLAAMLAKQWQQYITAQSLTGESANIMVIAVPLHISKWQQRSYNQAHLLAKHFSQQLNYHYCADAVFRNKATQAQVGQSGASRRRNLKNAFSLNPKLKAALPEEVIIIDDVVTTGATANEICALLQQQGVQKITLLCLAIALPSESSA